MLRPSKRAETCNDWDVDLSDFVFLSKTVQGAGDEKLPGLDVETHCRITGYVASSIILRIPEKLRRILFVRSSPLAAAVHDIGKINPDFQKMIYEACSPGSDGKVSMALSRLSGIGANSANAKRAGCSFHAKVTQVSLAAARAHLKKYIALIEGMHHGFRPVDSIAYPEERYGGDGWTQARHALLEKLESEFSTGAADWQDVQSWDEACVLGGLVIVADWIASGGCFAGLKDSDMLGRDEIVTMADRAVRDAGFHRLSVMQGLSFRDIFGFAPRDVQKSFFDSVSGPGVYVLEAPMGLGKTEAALYAAYRVLSRGLATGLYFALPTQLTSNRIYERVELFLKKILSSQNEDDSLRLLHGAAWMERTFGEDGGMGKSWFDAKKRGILAPFAVGTVDQALMSVMDVKHSMVRSFGLAGRVVILDEIHSYDAYTGTILNALVESLRKSACTVILLSATLTARQKEEILQLPAGRDLNQAYPLVTAQASAVVDSEDPCRTDRIESDPLQETACEAGRGNTVAVSFCDDRGKACETALDKAFSGQQVLWIENTVQDAQDVFKLIAGRCGTDVECGLVHSRYEKACRSENEAYWVGLYGSDGKARRSEKGRILVGTQVLEQSLDIDADFLLTAVCPTDMLLQRMGRLWRHASNASVRPSGSECACLIIAPRFESVCNEKNVFGASGAVYSEYVLCRTCEQWKELRSVSLPGDIRRLLEDTYSDREESGLWKSYKDEMEKKKKLLEGFARLTRSKEIAFDNTKTESQVQTRYSELESVSVLLLRSFEKEGAGHRLRFCSGESILMPGTSRDIPERERMRISKVLMEHCVSVAEKNAPEYEKNIEVFSDYLYTGRDDDEHPLRCAIVGDDSMLYTMQKLPCGGENDDGSRSRFYYNLLLGYQVGREGIHGKQI